MKATLLTLLFSATLASAQTLVSSHSSDYITSEVYEMLGGAYHYSYKANSKAEKTEISNISIDLCNDNIFGAYGSDHFKFELKDTSVKFDSIKPSSDYFNFGFYSYDAPTLSSSNLKYGSKVFTNEVLSTGCVPEPSSLAYTFGSVALLFYRRRRTL